MYIKDIEEACHRILRGDKDALKELGLEDYKYPRPQPQNTATTSLQLQYNCTLNTAVVVRELNLSFIEKQCKLTLQYIETIARAKNIRLQHLVDVEDVAELMLSLIDQEKRKYWKEADEGNDSARDEEDDSQSEDADEGVEEKTKKEEKKKKENTNKKKKKKKAW